MRKWRCREAVRPRIGVCAEATPAHRLEGLFSLLELLLLESFGLELGSFRRSGRCRSSSRGSLRGSLGGSGLCCRDLGAAV